jgi:RNA polymerase sigma factor (sigma-70 family)
LRELIQEGYIGLMYACRKYDETRGLKFSTYSSYWIKRYFMNYLMKKQKENNISLPLKLEVLSYRDYNREIDLDVLNNNEKEIIKKRFFEKKKVIELAKEYGVSRNTMTNKIKKIIVKLKISNK